jgi:hypothetical protein
VDEVSAVTSVAVVALLTEGSEEAFTARDDGERCLQEFDDDWIFENERVFTDASDLPGDFSVGHAADDAERGRTKDTGGAHRRKDAGWASHH